MPPPVEPCPTDPAQGAPEPSTFPAAPPVPDGALRETVVIGDDVWLWALSCSTCGGLAAWPENGGEG